MRIVIPELQNNVEFVKILIGYGQDRTTVYLKSDVGTTSTASYDVEFDHTEFTPAVHSFKGITKELQLLVFRLKGH